MKKLLVLFKKMVNRFIFIDGASETGSRSFENNADKERKIDDVSPIDPASSHKMVEDARTAAEAATKKEKDKLPPDKKEEENKDKKEDKDRPPSTPPLSGVPPPP